MVPAPSIVGNLMVGCGTVATWWMRLLLLFRWLAIQKVLNHDHRVERESCCLGPSSAGKPHTDNPRCLSRANYGLVCPRPSSVHPAGLRESPIHDSGAGRNHSIARPQPLVRYGWWNHIPTLRIECDTGALQAAIHRLFAKWKGVSCRWIAAGESWVGVPGLDHAAKPKSQTLAWLSVGWCSTP